MSSPNAVVFVPLYTQEVARKTSPNNNYNTRNSPFRSQSSSPHQQQGLPPTSPSNRGSVVYVDSYSPAATAAADSSRSLAKRAYSTYDQADQMIQELKKNLEEERSKNSGLMTLVATGPGVMAESIKNQEERTQQAEQLANLRNIQLCNVGEALRKEIEAHTLFREEARDVVQNNSDLMDIMQNEFNDYVYCTTHQHHLLHKQTEEFLKTSAEMAQHILFQTSTIERLYLDVTAITEHAKREKNSMEIQQSILESTIANLRQDVTACRNETRMEQEKAKKQLMEKDEKILELIDDVRKEEEKVRAQELASKMELERNKRTGDDAMTVAQKENKDLKLKIEEQEGLIAGLRNQVNNVRNELEAEQENLNASKRTLHQARLLTEEQTTKHVKTLEEVRAEHEATKNQLEQQRREWTTTREKIDAKLSDTQQEVEALKRIIHEKELSVKELGTKVTQMLDDHHEEKTKIKKQVEQEVSLHETDKKTIKSQFEQLQDAFNNSRADVRTLNAQLREARQALIAGGDEQERVIQKIRADLEENIKEQRVEKSALQKKADHEKEAIQKLTKELAEWNESELSEDRKKELEKAIERHEKAKKELENQVEILDAQMQQQTKDLESLIKARDAKDQAVAEVSSRLDGAKKAHEQERDEFSKTKRELLDNVMSLSSEKKSLAKERDEIEVKLQKQKQEYEKTVQDLKRAKEVLEEGTSSKDKAIKETKSTLEEKLQRHKKEKSNLEVELSDKNKAIEVLQKQVKAMSETTITTEQRLIDMKKEYEAKLADQSKELVHKAEKEKLLGAAEETKKTFAKEIEVLKAKLEQKEKQLDAEKNEMSSKSKNQESELFTVCKNQREKYQKILIEFEKALTSHFTTTVQEQQDETTTAEEKKDSQQKPVEFEETVALVSIDSNTTKFASKHSDLIARLSKLGEEFVQANKKLKTSEENLAASHKKYDEYKKEVENSKEYKDALTAQELRKELEMTKDRMRSMIRYQMSNTPVQSHHQQNNNNNNNNLRKSSPPGLRMRAGSQQFQGSVNGSQPSTEEGSEFFSYQHGGGGGAAGAMISPGGNTRLQMQTTPPHELTSGSFLNVDMLKEMAKLKWQVVSETYCPGAPSTTDVVLSKIQHDDDEQNEHKEVEFQSRSHNNNNQQRNPLGYY